MNRIVKALAITACVAMQGAYAEEAQKEAPVAGYVPDKFAPGFGDVKVPILSYTNMENFMTNHDHLLVFAYQAGKPSEHYAFNELKPIIANLSNIDKKISFALVENSTNGSAAHEDQTSGLFTYFIYENRNKANEKAEKEEKDHDLDPEHFGTYYLDYEPGFTNVDQVTRWITRKNSGVHFDKVPCDQLASKMDKQHFNVIYFGAEEGKVFDGFKDVAKEKSFDFYNTEAACAKDYGVTAPGVSVVRTSGGASPLAWSGDIKTEADTKADAELTAEQKALAEHDVASSLEQWLEFESTPSWVRNHSHMERAWHNAHYVVGLCSDDATAHKTIRDTFMKWATPEKRDKMFFFDPDYCKQDVLNYIGNPKEGNLMVTIQGTAVEVFKMDQDLMTAEKFTAEALNKFTSDFEGGKLTPFKNIERPEHESLSQEEKMADMDHEEDDLGPDAEPELEEGEHDATEEQFAEL